MVRAGSKSGSLGKLERAESAVIGPRPGQWFSPPTGSRDVGAGVWMQRVHDKYAVEAPPERQGASAWMDDGITEMARTN